MLREAAAQFIEAGRAIGRVEHCKALEAQLAEILDESPTAGQPEAEELVNRLHELVRRQKHLRATSERAAIEARGAAERLMVKIEHPGARLARRLLRAARAAQRAWQRG